MEITIGTAILLGFWAYFGRLMFPCTHLWWNSLTTSLWVGLVLGDVPTAVMLGATFALIYIGSSGAIGGVPLQDECSACLVAIPAIMSTGLDTTAAIALAFPIGLLFAQFGNVASVAYTFINRLADKAVEKGNLKQLSWAAIWLPIIVKIFIFWLPISVLIYVGSAAAGAVADAIPVWLTNGLSAVAGLLPAVGFGIILYVMGAPSMWPFMIAGFFLTAYTGLSAIASTLVGAFIAYLYYLFVVRREMEEAPAVETSETEDERKTILTKKDLSRAHLRWFCFSLSNGSWDRREGINFGHALAPLLQKLYKDKPEEFSEALSRETEFFNTESVWGACIPGIALAMEESKAMGSGITGEAITATKTSLMGPFAGIGDTLSWGLVYFIILGLCIPGAANGNGFIAALPPFLMAIYGYLVSKGMFNLGYKVSADSAVALLKNGMFSKLIPILTVLGMFMVGALGASYVSVSIPITFELGGLSAISIQGTLDSIAPGLLSLGTIFLAYYITKKSKRFLVTALSLMAIGIVLGCLGIIA